jgi:hypothetical protein
MARFVSEGIVEVIDVFENISLLAFLVIVSQPSVYGCQLVVPTASPLSMAMGAPTALPPSSVAPMGSVPVSIPLSDAAAAAWVARAPETRPDNFTPNHTVPTSSQLSVLTSPRELDPAWGKAALTRVTGSFTGSTDEIIQWAAAKWGFPADMVRAIAVDESHWNQHDLGDAGHGVSLGLVQVKSSDYPGTCPGGPNATSLSDPALTATSCLSNNDTAFDVDYKLYIQRGCQDGHNVWYRNEVPSKGKPAYKANQQNDPWGCVGAWFSGNWEDSGSLLYQARVQQILAARTWAQVGFWCLRPRQRGRKKSEQPGNELIDRVVKEMLQRQYEIWRRR